MPSLVLCFARLAKNRQFQMACLFAWGFSMMLLLVNDRKDTRQNQSYSADYILKDTDLEEELEHNKQGEVISQSFNHSQPKYVILLAYQRVGSTFLGQVFNQNPEAMYVFEPLDAVYSAMYGTNPGWNIPSDIFTFSQNATLRPIPEVEHIMIQTVLGDLFSCNVSALPHQLLLHPFWKTWRNDYKSLADFAQCIRALTDRGTRCYKTAMFNQVCPERFGERNYLLSYRCKDWLLGIEVNQWFHDHYLLPYRECMDEVGLTARRCHAMFSQTCMNSTLRGIKTVRMTMETAARMISANPNVRVVHLIRDPHGVAKSRMSHSSFQGLESNQSVTAEARLYCQTVLRDVIRRKRIEAKHPGSTLQVIYEDFINRPNQVLRDIYKLLDSSVPEAVQNWLDSQIDDIKANSTIIAQRWKETQSPELIKSIYNECSDFYQSLDHKWT